MLEAKGLCKSYGEKTVLSDAGFYVSNRELVSIVGPSGEGKSTIARILCGTVHPDSGSVYLGGELLVSETQSYPPRLRREIQLIPQQPYASLDPLQKIGSAIAEPLLFHKLAANKSQAKAQAQALLERVKLPASLYDRRPNELSGGQAQRVLIARSLAVKPKLLIADEATSMLDVSSQAQIVRIFKQLIEEGDISILMISHDMPLVASVSDRVYRLQNGEMIEMNNQGEKK